MAFLITFFALNFVVFFHELGHFLAAKRAGIGVTEFSLGMGPLLGSFSHNDTQFSFRLFPLGGFVKLAGLDDANCPDEKNYFKKTISQRAFTLAAGSIMNVLLGFLILFSLAFLLGIPSIKPEINKVVPNSPAATAGIMNGDIVTHIDGNIIKNMKSDFIQYIGTHSNINVSITLKRNGETLTLSVLPKESEGRGLIGIELDYLRKKYNPFLSAKEAAKTSLMYASLVFTSIDMLVSGKVNITEMSGPVGIVQVASNQLEQGLIQFLSIIAMISISLGVINLFPFPILDGGHLLFLAIEKIRKKPINKTVENWINNAGIALLALLTITILLNDIKQWSPRTKMLDTLNSQIEQ
ncbi:RIP metalloprotease RseP [bacterium]|nr:RIP metalloprotease RseP [bacterium]